MPFNEFRNREIARKTCLRGFAGRESIKSAFFAAETLKEQSGLSFEAGKWIIPVGSFLTYFTAKYESIEPDPTKVKIYEKLGENKNAKQSLTEEGSPTGGTFTITYGGQTTATIAYNAEAKTIVEKVVALSTVGTSANFKTTSTESKKLTEEALSFEFTGLLGNQPQPKLEINNSGLTGGSSPKIVVATTQAGKTAEKIMGVYDGPEMDLWGNTANELNLDEPIPVYFHACSFDKTKLVEFAKYGTEAEEALKNCTFY